MELSGTWSAAIADEDLRRSYPQHDFDDAAWTTIEVPGHWRSRSELAHSDGPILYRHHFDVDQEPDEGARQWLVLDGVFYESDVWLDGSYVGDTEGYFVPHEFDVTDLLRGGREHVLAMEVSCSRPRDLTAKRAITGVFQHWDCLDPDDNPGGIWRPVRIEQSGPVRISRLRVLCPEATSERALVDVRVVLDSAEPGPVQLRTTIGDAVEHVHDVTVASGENRIGWSVTVDNPRLWWPRALGDQPRYPVEVSVSSADDEEPSDRRKVVTGLRQVAMDDWIFSVNGERFFLKGANLGPTRARLAEATPTEVSADVGLALDAGLDMLRVHAHVARPELYEAADEAGLLLWQDFPLQWGYARSVRKEAARQARAAVDLLGHHPSIALWCGHNEPMALDLRPGTEINLVRTGLKALAMQQLPTWNKTLVDRSVKRALAKADATRPVVAHSGVMPGVASGGTDSHLYFGWYWGSERDLPVFCAAWPRQARFVSEFGAQAVPDEAAFMDPEAWPALDWDHLGRHHGMQRQFFERNGLDPDNFATFDEWRVATQSHQAMVIRHHVETLRRLKYRPTGGFAQFLFADAHPAVSWSVLDHERRPKPGFEALRAACAPVIVVAERPADRYHPGERISLDIHVISDRRLPITGATVNADLAWPNGAQRWSWTGDVAADSCAVVGAVEGQLGGVAGQVTLRLDLTDQEGAEVASNRYESTVAPAP